MQQSIKNNSRQLTSFIVRGNGKSRKYEISNKFCKLCKIEIDLEIHHETYPKTTKEIKKAIDEGKIYFLCRGCHLKVTLKERQKNSVLIGCECGFRVKGHSKAHAEGNLKAHKKSKLHKKLMESKK